jgi:ATP-dependent exoDNAse (exonuclease V) alpha subunit
VTSHAAQGKTFDRVIVSVPIESFSQANEAQFYVSMSRAREAMHLFTDSKAALREAVAKPSSRLSPLELILDQTNAARAQGARAFSHSRAVEQLRQQESRQNQQRTVER